MPSPETMLKEQKALIEGLRVSSQYLSDHVSNYAPINGDLPADKTKMLSLIDTTLEKLSKDVSFRSDLEGMRYLREL